MASIEDEESTLLKKRYFGAGIKRGIQFVPSTPASTQATNLPNTPSLSAADRYLALVLPDSSRHEQSSVTQNENQAAHSADAFNQSEIDPATGTATGESCRQPALCDICNNAILAEDAIAQHESSITHQICLQHSHPPSHIDRSRKGLAVLESHGWDLDSRLGLGLEGRGRLYPVKAKENPRRAGLGVKFDVKAKSVEKPVKLDAGKVRDRERQNKKKAERLRNAFYRSEEVEKYLGQE